MTVRIEVSVRDEIGPHLRKMAMRLDDLEPVLDEIGASLVTSTQQRFESETGPDGEPWKDLSPVTLEKRGARAKKLRDRADLYDSIGHAVDRDKVLVGANRPYARIHQLGGQAGRGRKVEIPARPYLGLSREDRRELAALVAEHVRAA